MNLKESHEDHPEHMDYILFSHAKKRETIKDELIAIFENIPNLKTSKEKLKALCDIKQKTIDFNFEFSNAAPVDEELYIYEAPDFRPNTKYRLFKNSSLMAIAGIFASDIKWKEYYAYHAKANLLDLMLTL